VTRALAAIAAAAALGAGGCSLEPDVGPLLAGVCNDTDSNPNRSVSFAADIRPLLDRPMAGCSCHMPLPGGAGQATQLSGLSLSSYASLREGGINSGSQVVIAGEPCASILYQKLSDAPPFGSRMPLTGPPFLTPDELALIHDWIAEGAANN
jgi:hypothetical protein